MSISASIDIKLIKYISSIRIIQELSNFGWTLNHRGKMSYLPINDNGMFNWTDEDFCEESLIKILKQKEKLGELIGVGMVWQDINIGGEFLFYPSDKLDGQISIILSMNRKILQINTHLKITDVNWYLIKLLPPLNKGDFNVEFYSYSEHK